MKVRSIASCKIQIRLKSLKESLKFKKIFQIFTVPDILFLAYMLKLSTPFH